MKRTRRVEVVRYSRRLTVICDDAALESDLAAEQAMINALLELPPATELPGQETSAVEQQVAGAHVPGAVYRRWPLRLFKRFIRG